jgi:pyrroloquinoline quinone biosynthesis protein D
MNQSSTSSMPFRTSSDTVSRRLGDAAVLIRLSTNRIYELNSTGARLWDLLQGDRSLDDIVDTLCNEFDGPSATIRADVDELLQQLTAEGLVHQQ